MLYIYYKLISDAREARLRDFLLGRFSDVCGSQTEPEFGKY